MARTIPQGSNHYVRPEPRTILADAPAFVFDPALADRSPKLLFWFAVLDVLVGIEAGEVSPDDLFRPIAFNPFRSKVPTNDPPVPAKHENRIVFNARYH